MAATTRKRPGSDADWLDDWATKDDVEPSRPLPLGLFALILVVLLIALEVVGVFLALDAQYDSATLIGHIVTLGTAAPLLLGLAALITGWGRGWGFVAVVLSVLANPLVLNAILDWGAGLS
ncbi:MAG TPA: hypothetical protein PK781_10945 [Terrimesophilobacter sp.]|nr:hypothetical protein [Terrimesophilobacter sp.]